MGAKAASRDVAPIIRGAFKRAVRELEDGGRPLSTMILESLEKDFLGTLRALSGFVPKELEATIEHKRSIRDFTEQELLAIASGSSEGSAEDSESAGQLH